jgi:hypothetical protein
MTQEQAQNHMSDVAKNRSDQLKILSDALVYRLEGMHCCLSLEVVHTVSVVIKYV